MSELPPDQEFDGPDQEQRCVQCEILIRNPSTAVATNEGTFCATCFRSLKDQLQEFSRAQKENINYPSAAIGGVLGGALGAVLWWGFTVVTKISFGLVAGCDRVFCRPWRCSILRWKAIPRAPRACCGDCRHRLLLRPVSGHPDLYLEISPGSRCRRYGWSHITSHFSGPGTLDRGWSRRGLDCLISCFLAS